MLHRGRRVLWLLNHVTLMKTEIPIMLSMGYEVFTPKIIPNVTGLRSGAVDYTYDAHLTLPRDVLELLNSTDFYADKWPDDVIRCINEYFSAMFFIPIRGMLRNALNHFDGAVLMRTFGIEADGRYIDMLAYNDPNSIKRIYEIHDRFWFASAYAQLREVEPRLLSDRDVFLPIGVPSSFDLYKNTWRGGKKQILFVCPSIETIPFYKNIYLEFKREFGHRPHVIVGSQPVPVNDEHVLGFVSDERFVELLQESSVMYYHSHEPRHVHYHPIEASVVGTPLVMYEDNLMARMAGRPIAGAVSSLSEARDVIESLLAGDAETIRSVKADQAVVCELFSESHCAEIWEKNFSEGPIGAYMTQENPSKHISSAETKYSHVPRKLLLLPGASLDTTKTPADGIDFTQQQSGFPHFVEYVCGISNPDPWGAWSDGEQIEIGLSQPIIGEIELEITGGAYGQNIDSNIKINIGSASAAFVFDSEPWHAKTQTISINVVEPSSRILIHVPHPTHLDGKSGLGLGIGLSRIAFKSLIPAPQQVRPKRWLSRLLGSIIK